MRGGDPGVPLSWGDSWLAPCIECGAEGLFRFGRGSCRTCKKKRWEQVDLISQPAHSAVTQAKANGLLPVLNGHVLCVDCGQRPAEVYDHRSYARPL